MAGVLSLVDHTHPTAAQLLCDFVVGDGLVDHGLVGWSEAFEFFKPVEDDVDLARLLLLPAFLNHHEPPSVRRNSCFRSLPISAAVW